MLGHVLTSSKDTPAFMSVKFVFHCLIDGSVDFNHATR